MGQSQHSSRPVVWSLWELWAVLLLQPLDETEQRFPINPSALPGRSGGTAPAIPVLCLGLATPISPQSTARASSHTVILLIRWVSYLIMENNFVAVSRRKKEEQKP